MRRVVEVMGVPISFHLPGHRGLAATDPAAAERAVDDAVDVLRAADRRFSRHRPGSELTAVRRGLLDVADASPALQEVVARGQAAERASDGAFRLTGPDGLLDTDGVVKGWAAQRAADLLTARGVTDLCLNAGGDVVVRGGPEPGRPWSVAVRDPADATRTLAVVHVTDGAVATSGRYERGDHLWDGRTGHPATALASTTVVAADLTDADVLATAAFARGVGGAAWAVEWGAAWALEVHPDGTPVTAGAGLPSDRRTRTASAA
ncbi:thiamine biosynthesis lipoprotein [Isoptericola jiangsuensis]|uniref:FAD:protein FMN transferase n=1 Tax=Isoptericola jiangsuensis TaxID=548579 RepID=A0A2A9ETU8_9MICO|nr:FAD:protein FMN transferase [Isoptericola jiangsuensis]PFG41692.1 thiamine biosynthesis lipoprotein [Isoptericola jiangsuensis]